MDHFVVTKINSFFQMMASETHSTIEISDLEKWLEALPTSVSYQEPGHGGLSRQQYLNEICRIADPPAVILAYLQDQNQDGGSFLTLAYIAPEEGINHRAVPTRIELTEFDESHNSIDISKSSLATFFSDNLNLSNPAHAYILPAEGRIIPLNQAPKIISSKSAGIAIALLPNSCRLTPLILMQLEIARRQFFAEIARSRQERIATALNDMLHLLSEDATAQKICERFRYFCRSVSVLIFERKGEKYFCIASADQDDKQTIAVDPIAVDAVAKLIEKPTLLRSHVYAEGLPKPLPKILGTLPWMLVPCLTDAINILTGTNTKYPQYLILAAGKQKAEYRGNDYSLTDLNVATSLASLLSSHLPYIGLSRKISEISRELDEKPLRDFNLSWLYQLASSVLPSLQSVAIFPEFPSNDGARFEPRIFRINKRTIHRSETSQRDNESCLASGGGAELDLNCMIYKVSTEYRGAQKIVFSFDDQFIQLAHSQLLNTFVEYVRGACSVIDFREYHIATQAQIRHVIRGSLSAAISEIELISNRFRIFAGMPTKLAKLFQTPTMRDSMRDTLLWLNEAYSLADAPRYLLDSFDSSSIRWSDVDLVGLVNATLAINRGEIRRRGLRVELIVQPEMKNRVVSADPEFLKIVIFNLIDNAVKYSFQDRRLDIELSYLKDHRWRFEVTNVGVPIDHEERDKIFDPWVRSFRQYLATRRPGTGLGLAVSRRILEAHDDQVIFNFTSEVLTKKPLTAETRFFFELDAKGKGEAARA